MLGWASAVLGLPGVAAPGRLAEAVGSGDRPGPRLAATAVGVREFVAAAGLLAAPRRFWLWARVAGDAMDLALLSRPARAAGRRARRARVALGVVAGITLVDLYAA